MNKVTGAWKIYHFTKRILIKQQKSNGILICDWRNGATSGRLHTCSSRRTIEKARKPEAVSSSLIELHGKWPGDELENFLKDMRILPNFISEEEEAKLFEEVEPYMKRLRYEYDHWDDAIHGYRETERKHWYPHNRAVLDRVSQVAFDGEIMPFVHVLDLSKEGVIKPHVDSMRYCGNTIAGISLLSDCIMRLVRTDEQKYQQAAVGKEAGTDTATAAYTMDDSYRNQPKVSLENNFYADLLLQRRSLYIMSYSSRYNFTHEILANEASKIHGKPVEKSRRISIICRNEP